jgi:hypothetical protein
MIRALHWLAQILTVRCTIAAMDRHPEPVAKQPSADPKTANRGHTDGRSARAAAPATSNVAV